MKYKNRPPHLYLDNMFYFLTARTLNNTHFFSSDEKKQILIDVIREAIKRFYCNLWAWVVLHNHYHILFKLQKGEQLSSLMNNIHANSSRLLNKKDSQKRRKIWWNYWDHGIRDEKDFYMHFNYIHHNPVKHGYVKRMEDYKFSSCKDYRLKHGQEWLDSCFEQYPIVDFIPQDI